MGRPRKRRFVEASMQDQAPEQIHISQEPEPSSYLLDSFEYVDEALDVQYSTTGQPVVSSSLDDAFKDPVTRIRNSPVTWLLPDQALFQGPPINFGDVSFGPRESNSVPPLDPIFHLSPVLPSPPSTDSERATPTNTSPCSCLSSIYLSLAALQQLPSDIAGALKTVRRAAAVAAKTIWCPQCGAVLLTTTTPLIESFQNTMLLGTLLPIVAHGYQTLLSMVDDETNAAIAGHETKSFNLHDYGGICGRDVNSADAADSMSCIDSELLFNTVDMPPIQWRTTVRALLRVDIYGHESPGFKHKGLKDLVGEMEYRQRVRHELIDAAQAAGTLDSRLLGHGFHHKSGKKSCDPETPQCLQMIKMAKQAIDHLLIA